MPQVIVSPAGRRRSRVQTGTLVSKRVSGRTKLRNIAFEVINRRISELNNLLLTGNTQSRKALEIELRRLKSAAEKPISTRALLMHALKAKDRITYEHSVRVARLSIQLGRELGVRLSPFVGKLHDTGKLLIRDEVLKKPGKLTDAEFDEIKQHAGGGADLLEGIFTRDVVEVARYHHEKVNGTGYHKLQPHQIPNTAKIVAVADVFDALVYKRQYKAAMSPQDAFAIIEKDKGSHFDPQAVEALQRILERKGVLPKRAVKPLMPAKAA